MERKSLVPLASETFKIVRMTTAAVRGHGKVEDRKGYKGIFSGSREAALAEARRIADANASAQQGTSIQHSEEDFDR